MKTLVLLIAFGVGVLAQDGVWQPQRGILYTRHSPDKQARALKSLGLTKGDWIIAAVRTGCGDCEVEAKRIADTARTVILVDGRPEHAREWCDAHGIKRARTVSAEEDVWGGLGVYYFPTFIRVQNGRIIGVRRTAP